MSCQLACQEGFDVEEKICIKFDNYEKGEQLVHRTLHQL